jgi:hypothetical protein
MAIDDKIDPFLLRDQVVGTANPLDRVGCEDFIADALDDVLNGQNDKLRATVLNWPSLGQMNTVAADLLHDLGLDPAVLSVLGNVLGTHDHRLTIIDDSGDDETVVEFSDKNWSISLG